MAIDTAAKRSSSLDHEEPWSWGAPLPDGTVGQGDRQHSIWSYSGILAGQNQQPFSPRGKLTVGPRYGGRVYVEPRFKGQVKAGSE